MTKQTRERTILALFNAAEFIRQHTEVGLFPEDVGEVNERGLREYDKACKRAAKLIESVVNRQQRKIK